MEWLKITLVVGLFIVVAIAFYGIYRIKQHYNNSETQLERRVRKILEHHAAVVESSNYQEDIQRSVGMCYHYILHVMKLPESQDLYVQELKYNLDQQGTLRDLILPFLRRQVYHDLEPLDQTLNRLIKYYNEECSDRHSLADLFYIVLQNTPPVLHGHDSQLR